jgi:hypothetical protein
MIADVFDKLFLEDFQSLKDIDKIHADFQKKQNTLENAVSFYF